MTRPLLTLATLLGIACLLPAYAQDRSADKMQERMQDRMHDRMHDRKRDVEGEVESIDSAQRTLKVKDVTIHFDDRTDYDDDYRSFEDIKEGDRVEVDYIVRDGKNIAVEVERDD